MKCLRWALSTFLLLSVFTASVAAFETRETPEMDEDRFYLIASPSDLAWFRDTVNEGDTEINARLTQDVDLGGHAWVPIGDKRRNAFNGIFDGNGFYVRGLYVSGESAYAGFFGCIGDGGVVENLMIEGAQVWVRCVSDLNAGILAGTSHGVIQDCSVMRSALSVEDLPGAAGSLCVGVVVGYNNEGIILNASSVQSRINVRLSYAIEQLLAAGGIVGRNAGTLPGMGLLQSCVADDNHIIAEVRAHGSDAYCGGVLGLSLGGMMRRCSIAGGAIDHNFFMGSSAAVGGMIGSSALGSYIENCAVGANMRLSAHGGAEPSSVGGIAGSLVGSNVDGCLVESVRLEGTGDLAHVFGGIAGVFAGGKISSCVIEQAAMPQDPDMPYRIGAVAGVTFEVEIFDVTPPTLIENTFYEESIAAGRPVGSDSNPGNTQASPFSKENALTYSIDAPSFHDESGE